MEGFRQTSLWPAFLSTSTALVWTFASAAVSILNNSFFHSYCTFVLSNKNNSKEDKSVPAFWSLKTSFFLYLWPFSLLKIKQQMALFFPLFVCKVLQSVKCNGLYVAFISLFRPSSARLLLSWKEGRNRLNKKKVPRFVGAPSHSQCSMVLSLSSLQREGERERERALNYTLFFTQYFKKRGRKLQWEKKVFSHLIHCPMGIIKIVKVHILFAGKIKGQKVYTFIKKKKS